MNNNLFQAALRTHYTDDVFIGICVNKTSAPTQKSIALKYISSYHTGQTKKDWDEAIIPFFHFPDKNAYINFFYLEFNELVRGDKISAPAN